MLLIAYACATIQAAILAGLAFSGALTIYALTALAAFHGAAHAFSIPASYGLLPRFIEPRRLSPAIAVGAAYSQLGLFVGPALAGWIILRFGTPTAFASSLFLLTRLAGAIGVAAVGAAAADWGLRGPLLCGAALALVAWGWAYTVRHRTSAAFAPRRILAAEGKVGSQARL